MCDFYTPKDSSKAQLLESWENPQKMRGMISLTEDEQAAIDDGRGALDRLLDRLADIPTSAGPTPRQLNRSASATIHPIVDVPKPRQDRFDNSDSTGNQDDQAPDVRSARLRPAPQLPHLAPCVT